MRKSRIDKGTVQHGDPMWVLGYITAYGEIRTRVADNHTLEERFSGRAWRWDIWRQDWGHAAFGCNLLNEEEELLVLDWLEREGYADPEE